MERPILDTPSACLRSIQSLPHAEPGYIRPAENIAAALRKQVAGVSHLTRLHLATLLVKSRNPNAASLNTTLPLGQIVEPRHNLFDYELVTTILKELIESTQTAEEQPRLDARDGVSFVLSIEDRPRLDSLRAIPNPLVLDE